MPVQTDMTYYYRIHAQDKASATFQFDATFAYGSNPVPKDAAPYRQDQWTSVYAEAAEFIVAQYGQNHGICIDYGCGLGRLAWEIVRRSRLRVIGFTEDPEQVMQARQILDKAGVYGTRVVIHEADLGHLDCRDYLANLIVSDQMVKTGVAPGTAPEMFRILRPDGGVALLGTPHTYTSTISTSSLSQWLGETEHSVDQTNGLWALIRRGPLPGAGSWDHFYANPANTANSNEAGLTDGLRLLWYGQPGPRHITDRHNRPMASLYREGIMVTPGLDRIMAYDAYNGTRYWDMVIPGSTRVAVLRDSAWLALAPKRVYVAHRQNCVALDLRTGVPQEHFAIPRSLSENPVVGPRASGLVTGKDGEAGDIAVYRRWSRTPTSRKTSRSKPDRILRQAPRAQTQTENTWGYIALQDDRLYGSSQQASASVIGQNRPRIMAFSYGDNRPIAVSESLFCRARHSGKLRWTYGDMERVIINPSITIGKGALVFLESAHPEALSPDQARIPAATLLAKGHAFLVSLDPVTGAVQWRRPVTLPFQHVIHLQIAEKQGLIIASGARDLKGKIHYDVRAFLIQNGHEKWACQFATDIDVGASHGEQEQHPIIINDNLYTKYFQINLQRGSVAPFSLDQATRGCATLSACSTHVFARGSNPFMYGLPDTKGTRLTSETRPGCWINIFPVGGLVMIPESSSGCSCDFPIQATMAFQPLGRSEAPADEH